MPSVLPRSSTPVNCDRFHSPRRIDASAAAVRRASPYSSASVCSAAAIVLPVGALTTVIPARVAASRSTLSTPTPARPMTTSRVPAAISSASTLTWLRTTSASYSGRIAAISVARQAELLVDLVVGAQQLEALGREGLDDEDPHAGTATPASRRDERPLGRGDGRARLDVEALLDGDRLEHADRGEDLVRGHRAEVAEPEDLALELALAAGEHEAARA